MSISGRNPEKFFFFPSFSILLCFLPLFPCAENSITPGELIRDKDNGNLVSKSLNFEMGFFSLGDPTLRYVGVWYYNIAQPTYIWVANRDKPIKDRGGVITIESNGKLVILDGEKNRVWTSNVSGPSNGTVAVLDDSGLLSLRNKGGQTYWRSLDHPTDTFLPGMQVPLNATNEEKHAFVSWKSATDPSPGKYSMGLDNQASPQIVVWEREKKIWRSGYFDNRVFNGVYNMTSTLDYGFKISDNGREGRFFTFTLPDSSVKMRFRITWEGEVKQYKWNDSDKEWNVLIQQPYNECDNYNKCGNFGVCVYSDSHICRCMKGFTPKHSDQWKTGNWSGGCERLTHLKAETNNTNSKTGEDVREDGFLELKSMKLPDSAQLVTGTSADDCESTCQQKSNCTAFTYVTGIGCLNWHGELVDVQQFESRGNTLYIRLAASELDYKTKNTKKIIIISAVVAGFICLGGFIVWLVWKFKGKLEVLPTVSYRKNSNHISIFDPSTNLEFSAEFLGSAEGIIEGSQGPELPLYNFTCITIATSNFSEENKLGQGGFGPVYKGKLRDGQEIAIKRLSRKSGQGLEEFKNEVILMAKLQHRNLVRLMGCSIHGEEKLLVYEYMPNRSLDCFLFDPHKQILLDWEKRFSIIEGIARGLLYLHRDSRLRIIHRDLKASNILLDEEMNPKISDFGLARIFGGNQNEANTNRVVGTYGYMSPEYAMEGLFSFKSDVYSFGVLLLEIVSGRRNTSFRHSNHTSLVGQAWHLWNEDKAIELVDPVIRDSTPIKEAMRCIHIGMLCVQDSGADRPNMSSLVLMLESETVSLRTPRQPAAFTSMRKSLGGEFYADGLDVVSNDLTVTAVVGR
ncbi:hypothetical protein L6164_032732 [Bauhinia variegata]|uniref:Uncharacterized protein n=1 Tax=Bauhinia variegata TaxID=167791 RepID=A0ACB9KQ94_BAUVA|nr:hypothetical protein L6164_032732 [Bauhinia variegata]